MADKIKMYLCLIIIIQNFYFNTYMEQDQKVVLLTGLTGYVATHIAKLLLEKLPSNYKLKATVRNK